MGKYEEKKRPFFRAAMAGLGKYCMGGYGSIGLISSYGFLVLMD